MRTKKAAPSFLLGEVHWSSGVQPMAYGHMRPGTAIRGWGAEPSVNHWLHLSSSPSIQVVCARAREVATGRAQGFTGQECGPAAELRPMQETLPQRR